MKEAGGGVLATYGPMAELSANLSQQASTWSSTFAGPLATCGNPTLDGALSALGGQLRSGTDQLAGASTGTAAFVQRTAGNFQGADGGR